jgi:hypothetical protein
MATNILFDSMGLRSRCRTRQTIRVRGKPGQYEQENNQIRTVTPSVSPYHLEGNNDGDIQGRSLNRAPHGGMLAFESIAVNPVLRGLASMSVAAASA